MNINITIKSNLDVKLSFLFIYKIHKMYSILLLNYTILI